VVNRRKGLRGGKVIGTGVIREVVKSSGALVRLATIKGGRSHIPVSRSKLGVVTLERKEIRVLQGSKSGRSKKGGDGDDTSPHGGTLWPKSAGVGGEGFMHSGGQEMDNNTGVNGHDYPNACTANRKDSKGRGMQIS